MKRLISRINQKGFSLVVTITMMVLLAMVSLGLLSLSAVEIRTSQTSKAGQQARANAKLALMSALGQIQKCLGPDQRISANAAQLSKNPDPFQYGGIRHPHWVNVFRTTTVNGEPHIRRDSENGGLYDLRANGTFTKQDALVTTLVSGNENVLRFTEVNGQRMKEDGMTQLLGEGTLGKGADKEDKVKAPLVEIYKTKDAKTPSGHYAWWVGDLGVKANIATPDAFEANNSSLATRRRLQLAQDASLQADGFYDEVDSLKRTKLVSDRSLELLTNDAKRAKSHYHDFTTESRSVLANVREGGLQQDLSAFLTSSQNVNDIDTDAVHYLGLSDTDNLIGPRNEKEDALSFNPGAADRITKASPTFAVLRDWAQLANRYPEGKVSGDFDNGTNRKALAAQRSFYGQNTLPAKFDNLDSNDISPIVTEGSIYYNLSQYATGLPFPRSHHLRLHLYPRVALWNPYNFKIEVPASIIQLFVNGAKQIEVRYDPPQPISVPSRFGPPKTIEIDRVRYDMWWGDAGVATRGRMYFMMEPVTLEPGETAVFSPAANTPYNDKVYNGNLLSPRAAPDPSRSFYLDKRENDERYLFEVEMAANTSTPIFIHDHLIAPPQYWREFVDPRPLGNIQQGGYTQADDYFMFWKPIKGASSGNLTSARFASLPHGQFVSCAFQYGDEDELPLEWNDSTPNIFSTSDKNLAICTAFPDRRTRDGFRLRWFNEHTSNRRGGGQLAGTPHLDTASIANWNLRSSYSFRSPYDNVSDVAPHFFGNYTRDLFDENVSWFSMTPVPRRGKYLSDPFQPAGEGTPQRILFDVPRRESQIVSLGAFQHAKFSELAWSPTYAIGNSLADPRLPLNRTELRRDEGYHAINGGWNKDTVGFSNDGRSSNNDGGTSNQDNWAYTARGYLEDFMIDNNVAFDLSYELNHTLWDRFFLSTGNSNEKLNFVDDPANSPLPNGRLRLVSNETNPLKKLRDFHRAASVLAVDGAFNVNSTSVVAWESLLLSTINIHSGSGVIAFPRIFNLDGADWDGKGAYKENAWSGQRVFNRQEIRSLAEAIVIEVKQRGPFLSLSDFINRRLTDEPAGRMGTLQAAIDRAGLNKEFEVSYPLDNSRSLPSYKHPDNIRNPTSMEQTLKPTTTAWGALGFLTQADLLQVIGHTLSARSDTFVVRAYGNATDKAGRIISEAWCEATVQRLPTPITPDKHGLNPLRTDRTDFGRQFEMTRFRWLRKSEV